MWITLDELPKTERVHVHSLSQTSVKVITPIYPFEGKNEFCSWWFVDLFLFLSSTFLAHSDTRKPTVNVCILFLVALFLTHLRLMFNLLQSIPPGSGVLVESCNVIKMWTGLWSLRNRSITSELMHLKWTPESLTELCLLSINHGKLKIDMCILLSASFIKNACVSALQNMIFITAQYYYRSLLCDHLWFTFWCLVMFQLLLKCYIYPPFDKVDR